VLLLYRNHQMVVTAGESDEPMSGVLVDLTVVSPNEEVEMGKLSLIAAIASMMWALPASAEIGGNTLPSDPGVRLARLDVCVGPYCRHERHHSRCRHVTIRERRGHEVVVRHERRCD
jgi:hypothetical protein